MSQATTKNVNTRTKNNSDYALGSIITNSLKYNIKQYTMVIALLLIWGIFTILTGGTFITARNLSNLFLQTATIAILAVGMVLVIVAGHIDLSVGSIAGFTGAIAAVLQVRMGFGTVPAILITLLCGLLIGIWQGYWIAYRGVPAFIVTLAGWLYFRGGVIAVTGGATIAPMNDSFKAIGQAYLPKLFFHEASFHDFSVILGVLFICAYIVMEIRQRKSRLKYGFKVLPVYLHIIKIFFISLMIALWFMIMISYLGIPYSVIVVIGLVLLYTFITQKTTFGRHVYAIGGNKEAARLSGINIKQRTMMIFVSMGLLASVAGMVFTARLNSATASAGTLFELDTIAAAIIGGTSTMGGEGTVFGAIIGALVMASLDNGMSLLNMPSSYQYLVKGLVLLIAVWIDIATRKKTA